MEHRTRPERGPFEVGQLVFLWRKNRFDNRAHWHGPAVVIGKSGASKVWVARGTKVYRCCPEQLRALSPDQEATVKMLPADMVHIRGLVSARGAGNFYDISVLDRPPDVELSTETVPMQDVAPDERDMGHLEAAGVGEIEPGEDPAEASGTHEAEAPVAMEHEGTPARAAPDGEESPSKQARVLAPVTPLTQMMRSDPEMVDRGRPSGSGIPVLQRVENIPVPDNDDVDEELEVHACDVDHWVVNYGRARLVRVHVAERKGVFFPTVNELPVEAQHVESVCCMVGFDRLGNKVCCEYDWKSGHAPELPVRGRFWAGHTEFVLKAGWSVKPNEQVECFEVNIKKGRKELTDHEIPSHKREGLNQAKMKEWKKLVDSGAIRVHTGEAANKLRQSLARERLLKSRFVLTEAEAGSSPLTENIKARWCVRGYLDPDLLHLDTSAPTLSAEGFAIAMQVIASRKWRLNIADVEGAFLRGDALDPKRGRLFIDLPPGGVPGVPAGSVVEAIKTIYGLADAPKAWWQCFSAKLRSLGMRVSRFDPCLYYYYVKGQVSGKIALHVDDLCAGGDENFEKNVLKPLRNTFPFKHWKTGSGDFLGKKLEQQPDGSIRIS